MGLCLSKKKRTGGGSSPSAAPPSVAPCTSPKPALAASVEPQKVAVKETGKKKENPVLVPSSEEEEKAPRRSYKSVKESDDSCGGGGGGGSAATVRTSSCTKEELDAILIQCGRLSQSSSGKGGSSAEPRRYSGSKRSYDFEADGQDFGKGDNERADRSAVTPVHRRNSSRERNGSGRRSHLKRSSSAGDEGRRGGSGSGERRRTSRSPRRRSDTPTTESSKRPARMVSVPATTSASKRGSSASPAPATGSGQPQKRGSEAARRTASPRSRSPATNSSRAATSAVLNENATPQPSLSHGNSRKVEQSPLRRNPMSEIDDNAVNIRAQQIASRNYDHSNTQKPNLANKQPLNHSKQVIEAVEKTTSHKLPQKLNHNVAHTQRSGERVLETCEGSNNSIVTSKGIREQLISCRATEQPLQVRHEITEEFESNRAIPGAETLNPISLTRSRSSRRSRDLDLLLNSSAFASLLMEDSQNLHDAIGFTLPPCVTKACSILEAVADLNSCANSTLSTTSTGGKNTPDADGTPNYHDNLINGHFSHGKTWIEKKNHAFVESEVGLDRNDLTEPSIHKYVTVRDVGGSDTEQQESAGSNSFFFLANGNHHDWSGGGASVSSSWEPNSADSTDRWASLSKATKAEHQLIINETEVECKASADNRRRIAIAAAESNVPAAVTTSKGGEKRELDRRVGSNQNAKAGIRPSSRRAGVVASQ